MPAATSAMPTPNLFRLFHHITTAIAPMATSAPREWLPMAAKAVSSITPVMPSFCHFFLKPSCT